MGIRTTDATPWAEDLAGLAALGFRMSEGCAAGCRDYHATWTYRRIMGSVGGVDADRPELLPIIRSIGAAPDTRRWLLAGSADSGLLATAAAGLAGADAAEFTLVDRCSTPLAVCRAYADRAGLRLDTHLADLTAYRRAEPFDVVVAHSVLGFLPPDRQPEFLAHLRHALRPGGHFVLCTRWGSRALDPQGRKKRVLKALESALAHGALSLPEPRADFEKRLCHDAGKVDDRSYIPLTVEACEALLRAAGFGDVRVTLATGVTSPFLSQRSRSRAIFHARA
jgi:SAM-dependent methyltransferase